MLDWFQKSSSPSTSRKSGDKLILFVHGLSGSALGSWGKMISALDSDADLENFSYDCYSFPTYLLRLPFGNKSSGIRDITNGLRSFLQINHRDKTDVFLIGHSLGGIIVRQFLLDECRQGQESTARGALLYAVPNTGASIAAVGSALSFGHRHLKQLCSGSDFLAGLNIDWVREDVENKLRIVYVIGGQDEVVTPESAACYIGARNVHTLIDHGHRAIIKPVDCGDIRYRTLKEFVHNFDSVSLPRKRERSEAMAKVLESVFPIPEERSNRAPEPLFDIYATKDEPFYIQRSSDKIVLEATSGSNAWVSGPSGVGKTATLKRLIDRAGWKIQHMMLGSFQSLSAKRLVVEICLELLERAGITDHGLPQSEEISDLLPFFRRAIRILSNEYAVAVLIEEIPLSPGHEFTEFLDAIYHLSLEGQGGPNRVVWLFSSINCPRADVPKGVPKFRERVQFISIEHWSNSELRELIDRIEKGASLGIDVPARESIIASAGGSPRFVKILLRNRRNGYGPNLNLAELIYAVRTELAE